MAISGQNSVSSPSSNAYTDLAALNQISIKGREDTAEGLKQVAKQFEAMFLNMMLKSMRESNKAFSEGSYLNSNEMEFYQQNFDDQMSVHLSEGKGMGLADSLYRQLLNQFDVKEKQPQDSEKEPPKTPIMDTIQKVGDLVTGITEQFSSPAEFIERLYPAAKKAAARIGVDPEVLLAQSALETGWGKKIVRDQSGNSSHNLFGIKADPSWRGDNAVTSTVEYANGVAQREQASFRHYQSYQHSFDDYVEFLQSNPRYQPALESADSAQDFAEKLQQAGYATDPIYAEKISAVLNSPVMRNALSTRADS